MCQMKEVMRINESVIKKTLWDSWMNGIVESGGRAGIFTDCSYIKDM